MQQRHQYHAGRACSDNISATYIREPKWAFRKSFTLFLYKRGWQHSWMSPNFHDFFLLVRLQKSCIRRTRLHTSEHSRNEVSSAWKGQEDSGFEVCTWSTFPGLCACNTVHYMPARCRALAHNDRISITTPRRRLLSSATSQLPRFLFVDGTGVLFQSNGLHFWIKALLFPRKHLVNVPSTT